MRVQSTYTHRNFHNYHISYGVKFSLTLLAASLFAALETNAATINLPGQSPAKLDYSSTGTAVAYVESMKNPTRDGSPYLFMTGESSDRPVLTLTAKGRNTTYASGNNQFFIMGGFRSVYLPYDNGTNKSKLNDGDVTYPSDQQNFFFSNSCENATVNLKFEAQASFYSVIYGSRNDISDFNLDEQVRNEKIGNSNNNKVSIDLTAEGSLWRGTLIMGGRSAQAEGVNYANQKGYQTNGNSVKITGRNSEDDHSLNLQFAAGGLWGAEGWEASNNLVLLDSAVVQSQSIKTRKLGIVGGRGFFDYRIYDSSDSDYDTKNNTIANGNVVIIKNSIISDADLISDETGEVHGMSIFGGVFIW